MKVLRTLIRTILLWCCFFIITGCNEPENSSPLTIAVFVPGMLAGSPTYEMMDQGVRRAASEAEGVEVKTIEAGFNQSEWEEKLTSLAAEGSYPLIVTSNPSMPALCEKIAGNYPEQRFICLEGRSTHPQIASFLFNHKELSFILGYFAGLITQSEMSHANEELRIGLIAGQEYPEMNQIILPGFELGMKTVNPDTQLDFRIVGNWYDANRASELARDMISDGIDVIMPIAGSANQGVIAAAREENAYCLWYDTEGYSQSPGIIVGSGLINEDKAAYELSRAFIENRFSGGIPSGGGIEDGYIDFISESSYFTNYVPEELREELAALLSRLKNQEIKLEMPVLGE